MIRKRHNYGFDDITQIHVFRNGLQQQHKILLEVIARGSL